eukprot:m.230966 g.230966  ORF g.230966 m.230966 type:complete len:67 (+) comp33591_c2_seq1:4205-4405(+)
MIRDSAAAVLTIFGIAREFGGRGAQQPTLTAAAPTLSEAFCRRSASKKNNSLTHFLCVQILNSNGD